MTVTVKLEPALEAQLRVRAATSGRNASEVIRAALTAYLAVPEAAPARSAHALGADLFGRHGGAPDLATGRKRTLAALWSDKQTRTRS